MVQGFSRNLNHRAWFSAQPRIFQIIYTLSLIGMVRGKVLHIPCYRLMFFNGIIDMMDLLGGSFTVAYLHFVSVLLCLK